MTPRLPDLAVDLAYKMSEFDIIVGDGTDGGCIPACYVLAGVLNKSGIAAKVIETSAIIRATGDARPSILGSDSSDGFLGHTVVYLPTKRWFIDASLQTQRSAVIPIAHPSGDPVFVQFDHTEHNSAEAPLDKGHIVYTKFKFHGTTWRDAIMPWKGLDQAIDSIYEAINDEGGKVYG